MSRRSAELALIRGGAGAKSTVPSITEAELRELERLITSNRTRPISALLQEVVERIGSLTGSSGAAIAVRDEWGVICRASTGEAPDVGSRLQPDSVLTRECFESGRTVVCEDTETDYRVRGSTAKSLRLRSAVVVPLQNRGSVLGVIEVLSSSPCAFGPTQVVGLQRVAELLVPALAPLPPQAAESEKSVVALPPVGPAAPKSRLHTSLVAGAIFLLLLLLLFVAVPRYKMVKTPSAKAVPSAPSPTRPAQPEPQQPEPKQRGTPSPSGESQRLDATTSLHPENGAPKASTSLSQSSPQPSAGTRAAPPEKAVRAEGRPTEIPPLATPLLVIQGVPPGAQIFVDDRLVSSTGSDGQARISTLAPGQHNVHVKLDGYRDYEQGVNVQANQTFKMTARLEPFEPPTLNAAVKAPVLTVAPALPAPVLVTRLSPPDFLLNRTLKGHSGWVTGVAFSPDGQRLASGSWDQTLKFWEVATGEQLSNVARKMKEVQALAFSRDGHWLATENSSNTVSLRDPVSGQEIRTFASDKPLGALGSNWVYSIAFSPDGQWLASGVDDKTVRLWDVKTGHKLRDLAALRRPVIYIAFSPDGRLLATGDDDKTIRIWDVASGTEVQKLRGHKKPIYAVAFSPSGHWLASASADRTVKLWDVASGREVHTLSGHGNVVSSLAFSPDSRWLVSGSWDKTIKIWEVGTGREVQTLAGHEHPIYSVAFDPRGSWLASGSEDGTIKLWRLVEATDQSRLRR